MSRDGTIKQMANDSSTRSGTGSTHKTFPLRSYKNTITLLNNFGEKSLHETFKKREFLAFEDWQIESWHQTKLLITFTVVFEPVTEKRSILLQFFILNVLFKQHTFYNEKKHLRKRAEIYLYRKLNAFIADVCEKQAKFRPQNSKL